MSEYTLDTDAAKQADTASGRITETGKYVGAFTKAKKVLSNQGTQGVEFSFKSNSGQTADYLSVWTVNKDGERIYGYKQLMAIMTCLKVRNIGSRDAVVEEYDRNSNSMQSVNIECFPDLQNKPIGVLLQMEEYEKKDGSIAEKPVFAGFFDPSTEQVATEILDKKQPEILEKLVSQLVPLKKLKGSRQSTPQAAPAGGSMPAGLDDIPF
jgi:hypothetical protein